MSQEHNMNTGKVMDIDEIQDKESAMRDWSEGDDNLFETLRACNENGIKTYACCAGHPYYPYICVRFSEENEQKIIQMVSEVLRMKRSEVEMTRTGIIFRYSGARKKRFFKRLTKFAKEDVGKVKISPLAIELQKIFHLIQNYEMNAYGVTYEDRGITDKHLAIVSYNKINQIKDINGIREETVSSGTTYYLANTKTDKGIIKTLNMIRGLFEKSIDTTRSNSHLQFVQWIRNLSEEKLGKAPERGMEQKKHQREDREDMEL